MLDYTLLRSKGAHSTTQGEFADVCDSSSATFFIAQTSPNIQPQTVIPIKTSIPNSCGGSFLSSQRENARSTFWNEREKEEHQILSL